MKKHNLGLCAALFFLLIAAPFLGMWYSPSLSFKPNFPAIQPLEVRQQIFINFMIPKINFANNQILQTRTHILSLVKTRNEGQTLVYRDRAWLHETADIYGLTDFNINHPADIDALLSRVDAIPASLILAQAGNESGWGTSRFAVTVDNFFGQHCNVSGCGILPLNRGPGETFEVQKFKTVQSSIDDYLYNLNTNPSYTSFRNMRASLRANRQPLVGFRLAPFLENYSSLGERYVLMISAIIVNHNLMQYDEIPTGILNS